MLKTVVALLAVVAISVAYTDMDDAYYDTMLKDAEAVRLLFGCLVNKNPCNDFAQHAKGHVEEVLKTGCKNCDDVQKRFSHRILEIAKAKFPELYEEFEAKYDPKRKIMDAVDFVKL